jgi:hypothetical protein
MNAQDSEKLLASVREVALAECRKEVARATAELVKTKEVRRMLSRQIRVGGAVEILDGEDASSLYRFSPFLYSIVKAFKTLVGGE